MYRGTTCRRTAVLQLFIGAWGAFSIGLVRPAWSAADRFIEGEEAVRRLNADPGQNVLVVFQRMDGIEIALHARVSPRSYGFKKVSFDCHYKNRPKSEKPLVVEYLEKKLGRPMTRSEEDRKLIESTGARVPFIEVEGRSVAYGNQRFLVMSVEPLDMSGPEMRVAMTVKAVKLPPDDPWTGDEEGEPSNWAIEYSIKGIDKSFRYRIPFMRRNPERAPIDSVIVHKADWRYDRFRYMHRWGIRFEVRQGASAPFFGLFELDDHGYPVDATFVRKAIFDRELAKRLTPWYRYSLRIKNHEFNSKEDAYRAQPKSRWDRSEISEICHDLLASAEDPQIRAQVLGIIERTRVLEDRTVPLVEKSLESDDESEVAAARFILERHAKQKARDNY
jgi:hypothetical protein